MFCRHLHSLNKTLKVDSPAMLIYIIHLTTKEFHKENRRNCLALLLRYHQLTFGVKIAVVEVTVI